MGQGEELSPADRAVRAPADAVEAATAHVTHDPRRQRVVSDAVVAALAVGALVLSRRLRR